MNHGYIKVCAATPKLIVADCEYNGKQILNCIKEANQNETEFIVFPELCITGYTCADLFYQYTLLEEAMQTLSTIIGYSQNIPMTICVGMPIEVEHHLYNCAVIINQGKILGVVPKTYIPNYNEFYEQRWFASGENVGTFMITICDQTVPFSTKLLFRANNNQHLCIGIEICEDAWVPISPSSYHALAGATVIFNLSASNELAGKDDYRTALLRNLSARTVTGYVYTSAGMHESSTDVVYSGHKLIVENGTVLAESERFEKENSLLYALIDIQRMTYDRRKFNTFTPSTSLTMSICDCYSVIDFEYTQRLYPFDRHVDAQPFIPKKGDGRNARCNDIFMIQTTALCKRMLHTNCKNVVIGISGGLDSTLALLVCVKAFDRLGLNRSGIIGVTMPGFGTTDRTYQNALELMKGLGITMREISIVNASLQHFKDIGHDPQLHDITYENTQARERTQILMDISNQVGGFVIGTGDLSELALGWATYNGDHMSMYAVNASIPKTLVRFLIEWIAHHEFEGSTKDILLDIADTPVSPELLPPSSTGEIKQKTEDIVGPYELHDFYLYYVLRYGFRPKKIAMLAQTAFKDKYNDATILQWMQVFYRRFFTQQFKRSCLPDGPKVGSICLSPRGDLKMPSDASYHLWMKEVESMINKK